MDNKQNHVMMFEFAQHTGPYHEEMVALFDKRDISEDEVRDAIHAYPMGYDARVVVISRQQYDTVFRSLRAKSS